MHFGRYIPSQVDYVIRDIEGLKMYIEDILVLSKDCFTTHIKELKIIFGRLRTASLKVNASKCSFGLKDIPHLGYVITR